MSNHLQVRDVLEALEGIDPTLPVTIKVWHESEDGEWDHDSKLLIVRRRSLDICLETRQPA